MLDPVRERARVAVEIAARDQHHRQHRQEEVRTQEHCVQLAVGRLVAAHPADRGALPRIGRLVLNPQTPPLRDSRTPVHCPLRPGRNTRTTRLTTARHRISRRITHTGPQRPSSPPLATSARWDDVVEASELRAHSFPVGEWPAAGDQLSRKRSVDSFLKSSGGSPEERTIVWAARAIRCPNPAELPGKWRDFLHSDCEGSPVQFGSTMRPRAAMELVPQDACHAEGRGFESHHPFFFVFPEPAAKTAAGFDPDESHKAGRSAGTVASGGESGFCRRHPGRRPVRLRLLTTRK